jgi:hypothetical protein
MSADRGHDALDCIRLDTMHVQDGVGGLERRRRDVKPSTPPSAASQIRQRRSRCDTGAPLSSPSLGGGPGRMSGELLTIARNAGSCLSQCLRVLRPTRARPAASPCVQPARSASAAI